MLAPRTLIIVSLAVFVAVAASRAAWSAQQPDVRRQAISYLREVNTLQARQFHGAKRYATAVELLVQTPLPAGWTFTMAIDGTNYLALLTGQEGEAFTTSNKGLIYEGRVLR